MRVLVVPRFRVDHTRFGLVPPSSEFRRHARFFSLPLWVFSLFDVENTGTVSVLEILAALCMFGSGELSERVQACFEVFDDGALAAACVCVCHPAGGVCVAMTACDVWWCAAVMLCAWTGWRTNDNKRRWCATPWFVLLLLLRSR